MTFDRHVHSALADSLIPGGISATPTGFTDLLRSAGHAPTWDLGHAPTVSLDPPDATTVIAVRFEGGVVMVGDRQATEGYSVAHRRIQKVFAADGYSAIAISGTAGLALEMVRLFQTELEHYEKLEGLPLSLEGKANYLARMVRQQLPMAFQGLVVVPLFCGYDLMEGEGRLFTFDVVGGRYEESDFGSTGSGSREAKSYLRAAYQDGMDEEAALTAAIKALVVAAEEDVATGGPDLRRGILPNVFLISSDGIEEVDEARIRQFAESALESVR